MGAPGSQTLTSSLLPPTPLTSTPSLEPSTGHNDTLGPAPDRSVGGGLVGHEASPALQLAMVLEGTPAPDSSNAEAMVRDAEVAGGDAKMAAPTPDNPMPPTPP